jgi:hypothetical protein
VIVIAGDSLTFGSRRARLGVGGAIGADVDVDLLLRPLAVLRLTLLPLPLLDLPITLLSLHSLSALFHALLPSLLLHSL